MSSDPKRLFDEDPGIAHLVAASEEDGPSAAQMDKLLSLATQAAATPRQVWWRGTRPSIALGVAAIGVSIFGLSAGAGSFGDGAASVAVAPPAPSLADHVDRAEGSARAEVTTGTTSQPPAEPVMTVSIDDLAPAPSSPSSAEHSTAPRAPTSVGASAARPGSPALQPRATSPSRDADGAGALAPADVPRTSFDEELALVSTARSALQRGDVGACMRAADEYRARFGAGTFAQEIEVIRIEGLLRAGEHTKARTAAEQFLAANAGSPYADRVRSLIDRTAR